MNRTVYMKYSGILPDGDEFDIRWIYACTDQTHDDPASSEVIDTTYYVCGEGVEENIFPLKSWYVDSLEREAEREDSRAPFQEPDDEPDELFRY